MISSQIDLSTGDIHRQLLRFSLPILATSLLQALYATADIAIVGFYLGSAGVSAISNASQITHMVTLMSVGLSHGGNVLVGQTFSGRNRLSLVRTASIFSALFLLLGTILAPPSICFSRTIVELLNSPAPIETQVYLSFCSIGFPFVLSYNASAAILRALGNSRFPLICIALAAVINLGLDVLFVGPLNMGVYGAALATAFAQGVSAVSALIYLSFRCQVLSLRQMCFPSSWRTALKILRLGIPGVVSMLMVSLSWAVVTWQVNGYGTDASAGFGIAAKIRDLFHLMISTLGIGTLSFIAQNLGARQYDRAHTVMKAAMRLALLLASITIVVSWLLGPKLIALFAQDITVQTIAICDLRIEVFAELFYAIVLIYQSMMNGAGHTAIAVMNSLTSCIFCRIPLAILFEQVWALDGIFLACAIAPAAAIPVGVLYIRSGRWRVSLVEKAKG